MSNGKSKFLSVLEVAFRLQIVVSGTLYLSGFVASQYFYWSHYQLQTVGMFRIQYFVTGFWFLTPLILLALGSEIIRATYKHHLSKHYRINKIKPENPSGLVPALPKNPKEWRSLSKMILAFIAAVVGWVPVLMGLFLLLFELSFNVLVPFGTTLSGVLLKNYIYLPCIGAMLLVAPRYLIYAIRDVKAVMEHESDSGMIEVSNLKLPSHKKDVLVETIIGHLIVALMLSGVLLSAYAKFWSSDIYPRIPHGLGGGRVQNVEFLLKMDKNKLGPAFLVEGGNGKTRSGSHALIMHRDGQYAVKMNRPDSAVVEFSAKDVVGIVYTDMENDSTAAATTTSEAVDQTSAAIEMKSDSNAAITTPEVANQAKTKSEP